MIEATGLCKSFGKNQAVVDVTLKVGEKTILGLVGPDGAGKTTLMRMICGLITPDRGKVRLMGHVPDKMGENKKELGYMPQRFSLYGDLSVMENIYFFASMYRLQRSVIDDRAGEILDLTRLTPFKNRLADQLSGGMKQKLALTCALITRPKILVLDEPTYGVDPESRKEFWKILYQLNREGMTIMVSTPYMDEAELCHQVAFMAAGRIMVSDSPQVLRTQFGYRILKLQCQLRSPAFLSSIPGVVDYCSFGYKYHIVTDDMEACDTALRKYLNDQGIQPFFLEEVRPSMEDIFVDLAKRRNV